MVRKSVSAENGYHSHWDVHICSTCCKVPLYWLCGCACSCCFTCYQRGVIIEDWDNYRCCQNYLCGCGEHCHSCTEPCPQVCACLESFICSWCALFSNRAYLQDKFQIANTKLEEVMMCLLCVCAIVICILSCVFPIPNEVDCLIDCIYLSCAGCFLSQQMHEWDYRMKGAPSLSGQGMHE